MRVPACNVKLIHPYKEQIHPIRPKPLNSCQAVMAYLKSNEIFRWLKAILQEWMLQSKEVN